MCFCHDTPAEFDHHERRKARKPHKCIECDCVIAPGTVYDHFSSKWEGTVSSHSSCIDCTAWGLALSKAQQIVCGCSGWVLGAMWHEIEDFGREHLYYDMKTGEELPRPKLREPIGFVVDYLGGPS